MSEPTNTETRGRKKGVPRTARSYLLTDETINMIEELAGELRISRNQAIERVIMSSGPVIIREAQKKRAL